MTDSGFHKDPVSGFTGPQRVERGLPALGTSAIRTLSFMKKEPVNFPRASLHRLESALDKLSDLTRDDMS